MRAMLATLDILKNLKISVAGTLYYYVTLLAAARTNKLVNVV